MMEPKKIPRVATIARVAIRLNLSTAVDESESAISLTLVCHAVVQSPCFRCEFFHGIRGRADLIVSLQERPPQHWRIQSFSLAKVRQARRYGDRVK